MLENITLNVSGMSCGHCVNTVEKSVANLPAIQSVKVNLDVGKVEIAFDNKKISAAKIKETIEEQGYDVE